MKTIKTYRNKIDSLDKKLLELIVERAECAVAIGKIKFHYDETVYNPKREKEILDKISVLNKSIGSPLPSSSVKAIFSEIISSCRSLEHIPKIAYLGPDGSFSHLAALKQFGSSVELLPQSSINASFNLLSRGHCDYTVLPIENSIEGMVNNTLDQLSVHNLYITAELYLPIRLCLFVVNKNMSSFENKKITSNNKNFSSPLSQLERENVLSKIKILYSHPQPFGQARNWIEKHLPRVKLQETHSTSHAAEECLKAKNSACIGSKLLRKVFPNLRIVEEKIEDGLKNTTRFVVISNKPKVLGGSDNITSLLITIKDKPGALYDILEVFAKSKINLTNLVSRPSKKKAFDYFFYIDFEGNINELRVQKVLKKIKPFIVEVKVLGCFTRGTFF